MNDSESTDDSFGSVETDESPFNPELADDIRVKAEEVKKAAFYMKKCWRLCCA